VTQRCHQPFAVVAGRRLLGYVHVETVREALKKLGLMSGFATRR
jgi:hypothetical protein